MENSHDGHRERLRERFLKHGLESFTDIEALELLLFYVIPRRDTKELAHALLRRFGNFHAVMEADLGELAEVAGIGPRSAELIKLVASLNYRYVSSERKAGRFIDSSQAAGDLLLPMFYYQNEEMVYALCLDSKSTVLNCRRVASGAVTRVEFTLRDIVAAALRDNASRLIIAHNHLSGTALPSNADLEATRALKAALDTIGVELLDHIIVCDSDYVSLSDSGFFKSL